MSSEVSVSVVSPEQVGVSSGRLRRIGKLVRDYVDDNRLAGAVTLLARRGGVFHFEKFGVLDIGSGQPMKREAIFRIYSMTKPVTSVAVMMLWENGHFELDDPVARFIPELDGLRVYAGEDESGMLLVEQERPISIRHLLTHTAGLGYPFVQPSPIQEMYQKADLLQPDSNLKEMVDKLSRLPLACQPGTDWKYSIATDVLGYLVEVVSGRPFNQFLQQEIFDPLGMVDTGFHVPEGKIDRLASVYCTSECNGIEAMDSPEVMRYQSPRTLCSGGGGLVSTAPDYLNFCQMLLNGGELGGMRLLTRNTVDLMTGNQLPTEMLPFAVIQELAAYSRGCGFGFGFKVVDDVHEYGVSGSSGMYSWPGAANTSFWVDPQEDLIAIFMTQFLPFGHYPVIEEFQTLTYQSLID